MNEGKYWYSVLDECPSTMHEMLSVWSDFESELDMELAAEDAGRDYYDNHDGWETQWPITIALYQTKDGPEVARFRVDIEMVREFGADRV